MRKDLTFFLKKKKGFTVLVFGFDNPRTAVIPHLRGVEHDLFPIH